MRIAVATIGADVSPYLEICDNYVIFETDGENIIDEVNVSARTHNPGYLLSQNIQAIIAGSMDKGSVTFFSEREIKIYINITGNAREVTLACAKNELPELAKDYVSDEPSTAPHECKAEKQN